VIAFVIAFAMLNKIVFSEKESHAFLDAHASLYLLIPARLSARRLSVPVSFK
jgi:hypothetical protein